MRRALLIGTLLAVLAGCGGEDKVRHRIELDNAFNLTVGGDLKVAGVPAGRIDALSVDRKRLTAVATVEMRPGAPRLRADARCMTRPQSLLGEYYITCSPGRSSRRLADGALIPTSRTVSTIPSDLVANILRVPERERLRLIVNEFGTGLAARGEDLNDAIREGVPALRETDRVLAELATQRRALARMTTNADGVVAALAARRRDVSRFVDAAGETAEAAAVRRDRLREGLRRMPAFLRELRATMASLDAFSTAQTPAVRQLGRVAAPLAGFLEDFAPFARAARPAVRSLGEASQTGRRAVEQATPAVARLTTAARGLPELSRNARFVLEHINDRSKGVRRDNRATRQLAAPGPGGDRFTGWEAFLQYVYDQSLAANMYTQNGHFLTVGAIAAGPCGDYHDGKAIRDDPALEKRCTGNIFGQSSPGIHEPDPGKRPQSAAQRQAIQERRQTLRIAQSAARSHRSPQSRAADVLDYLLAP